MKAGIIFVDAVEADHMRMRGDEVENLRLGE